MNEGQIYCDASTNTAWEISTRESLTLEVDPFSADPATADLSGWKSVPVTDTVFNTIAAPTSAGTVECVDWDTITAPTNEIPFKYGYKTFACDFNRVFVCEDPNLCMTVKPSTDLTRVWGLTQLTGTPVTPTVEQQIQCSRWKQGYSYLFGDVACDL